MLSFTRAHDIRAINMSDHNDHDESKSIPIFWPDDIPEPSRQHTSYAYGWARPLPCVAGVLAVDSVGHIPCSMLSTEEIIHSENKLKTSFNMPLAQVNYNPSTLFVAHHLSFSAGVLPFTQIWGSWGDCS